MVSHHRLALAGAGHGDDALAGSVLGNLDALRRALDLAAAPVSTGAVLDIHRALLAGSPDAAIAGRLRTGQNWIGGRHPNPRGAAFVPPPEDEVRRLVDDLCRFCERDDLPPLVQAAVAHVQFETIHPFADGNGRVGRALIHVVLSRRGLTRAPDDGALVLPPISLVLAARSDAYIGGLSAFRAGRHEEWLAFFLDAAYRSATVAESLLDEVAALQERWRHDAGRPRADSAAEALIARLPQTPVVDLAAAVALTGASREATRRGIERLEDAGVLRETTGMGRLRRWEAVGLFAILDGLEGGFRVGVSSRRPGPRGPRESNRFDTIARPASKMTPSFLRTSSWLSVRAGSDHAKPLRRSSVGAHHTPGVGTLRAGGDVLAEGDGPGADGLSEVAVGRPEPGGQVGEDRVQGRPVKATGGRCGDLGEGPAVGQHEPCRSADRSIVQAGVGEDLRARGGSGGMRRRSSPNEWGARDRCAR